jgi:hypothetical protein
MSRMRPRCTPPIPQRFVRPRRAGDARQGPGRTRQAPRATCHPHPTPRVPMPRRHRRVRLSGERHKAAADESAIHIGTSVDAPVSTPPGGAQPGFCAAPVCAASTTPDDEVGDRHTDARSWTGPVDPRVRRPRKARVRARSLSDHSPADLGSPQSLDAPRIPRSRWTAVGPQRCQAQPTERSVMVRNGFELRRRRPWSDGSLVRGGVADGPRAAPRPAEAARAACATMPPGRVSCRRRCHAAARVAVGTINLAPHRAAHLTERVWTWWSTGDAGRRFESP